MNRLVLWKVSGLVIASAWMLGCSPTAVQEAKSDLRQKATIAADETRKAVRNEVKQAVDNAIPAEVTAFTSELAHYQQMAKDGTWNREVKQWIEQGLNNADPTVQMTVIPVIKTMQRTVPESRAWLHEHVEPIAQDAKGAALPIWKRLLSDLKAATNKPATAKPIS